MWAWKIFGLILLPIALQTSVFHHFNFLGVVPNLVLVITICYGLLQGTFEGLSLGLIGGLCLDLASGGILGINIMILGLLGLGAGYLAKMVFKGNLFVPIISIFAGTIISEFLSYSVLRAFGWRIEFFSLLFSSMFPLCFYHLLLTGPVYIGLLKVLSYYRQRVKVGA